MKVRPVILMLPFLFLFYNITANDISVSAVKGVMDLRTRNLNTDFELRLNGEWEFYWNRFIDPSVKQATGSDHTAPDYYGKVPSYWSDYPQEVVKTDKTGYASYQLSILLPPGYRESLAFDLPVFDTSYKLFINGKQVAGNGNPGTNTTESEPEYRRTFIRYNTESDTITLLLHVSNYEHRRGGFWLPIKFGTFSQIQSNLANSWAGDWAAISFLMGFSLFFFIFFILYPKDKISGFFSMAVAGLALRPLFTSNFLILNFIDLEWVWLVRFEYLTLFVILTGWTWFSINLYPSKFIKITGLVITFFTLVASVIVITTPVKTFSYSVMAVYPSMIILMAYTIYKSLLGIIHKNRIDIVYFIALIILTISGLHDIMVSLGKALTNIGYSLSFIVVIFVFLQAILLLYKWVKAYYEKEKLHGELESMNRNLETRVNERTQELILRNEKIENQNTKIALQNKQLSDTIHLKNKVFSVIAHDLRSPVVNILYMLNLLKEKEYKENYDEFADSCINYSQSIITLLENMLVWGRGQEDKIKFSPGEHDLAGIILTNLSIFKETADRKEISLNFTQMGRSVAFFDKDLIDIVIRNIITNAVKYTNRGGRVSILLKDKHNDNNDVLIKICDNGIGIPPELQNQLFSNSDIKTTPGTENEKGTGLGLKLCYELIKINNGTLSVSGNEGEGSCFSITLPSRSSI